LNALHQPAVALYLSAARFAVFYVPLAYVGSLLYGLEGFFGGALLGNLIMAAISWHYFNKTVSQEQRLMAETAISA
ncbi:MAG: MATE family efflux transporter, partial [SAR86 cluster bacterium]